MTKSTDKTAGYPDSLDLGFVNRIRDSLPGKVVGFLSTLLKSPRLRGMYREVLETPIMALNRPVQKGQVIENREVKFHGGFGSFQGRPMIFVNPYITPTEIVRTLFEEGAHALRRAKGRPLRKQDLSLGGFDEAAYRTDPEEVSAKRMMDYAMEIAGGILKAAGQLPSVSFRQVWHIGSMDPGEKGEGSLEGEGLSISTHPEEWQQIAELGRGPVWELTRKGNRLLDFHRLTRAQRSAMADWGVQQGLIERKPAWQVRWWDSEDRAFRYVEAESEEEAKAEAEPVGGKVKALSSVAYPTARLRQATRNPRASSVVAMDLLATVYADKALGWDGVWWQDTLDVPGLSAPRGVIFPSRLPGWQRRQVDMGEIESYGAPGSKVSGKLTIEEAEVGLPSIPGYLKEKLEAILSPGSKLAGTECSPHAVPARPGWSYEEPLPDGKVDFFELVENPHTDRGRETRIEEFGSPPPEGGEGKPARGEPGQEGTLVRPMASARRKYPIVIDRNGWLDSKGKFTPVPENQAHLEVDAYDDSYEDRGGYRTYVFRGEVAPESVDWGRTVWANLGHPMEKEVTLRDRAPFRLTGWKRRHSTRWQRPVREHVTASSAGQEAWLKSAAQRGVWYHGSSIRNLPSILHQGLIPEAKDKNWGSDPDASAVSVSRVSYGGIYVTRNLMTAASAPKDHNTEGREVVVCMELQPSTMYLDEDAVVFYVSHPLGRMSDNTYYSLPTYLGKDGPWKEYADDQRQKYVEDAVRGLSFKWKNPNENNCLHPGMEERLRALLSEVWEAALLRIAAHEARKAKPYDLRNAYHKAFPRVDYDKIPDVQALIPLPEEGEAAFRSAVEKVTRALRQFARPVTGDVVYARDTARVTTPIGYSGSNRILAVVEVRDGKRYRSNAKGEWDSSVPTTLIVHFGSIPPDFFSQFKECYGGPYVVERAAEAGKVEPAPEASLPGAGPQAPAGQHPLLEPWTTEEEKVQAGRAASFEKTALNIPRLVQDFGRKLVERYEADFPQRPKGTTTPEAIVESLTLFDPTDNNEYTAWLAGSYARGELGRYQDLPEKVAPLLGRFHSLKKTKNLRPEDTNIQKVRGIAKLEALLAEYAEIEAASRRQRAQAMEQGFYRKKEATLLHDDGEVKVVVPHTKEASKFFGINTKWCTAAEENNAFEGYDEDGPLYIVLLKRENKRFQFHFPTAQFTDEQDRPLGVREWMRQHPKVAGILYPLSSDFRSSCEDCTGEGYRQCGRCEGTGHEQCGDCDGDGEERCSDCQGSGKQGEEGEDCDSCEGKGYVTCETCNGGGNVSCGECEGTGRTECDSCGGSGTNPEMEEFIIGCEEAGVAPRTTHRRPPAPPRRQQPAGRWPELKRRVREWIEPRRTPVHVGPRGMAFLQWLEGVKRRLKGREGGRRAAKQEAADVWESESRS